MRVALIVAALLSSVPVWAAEIKTEATVSAATVFPDGATVTRKASFSAPEGRHTLVLTGVPVGFDSNSLRASGEGDAAFSIISVEQRAADPVAVEAQFRSEAQKIETAIERLEDQKAQAENQIAAADRQIAFIDATIKAARVSGGKDGAAPTAQDWVTLWTQSNASSAQALGIKQRARVQIRELDRQIEQLYARSPQSRPRSVPTTIAVEIEASAAVKGEVEVKHFTRAASWGPVYDARLDTEAGELTLVRRAAIQQRTEEPWEDVALTLSTSRPTGGTAAPQPRRRIAQLVPERSLIVEPRAQMAFGAPPPPPVAAPVYEASEAMELMADGTVRRKQAVVVKAAIRTQGEALVYDIPSKADIPGSGVVRQVLVGEEKFDGAVELRATPSQDKTAYLYATFENGDGLILPGEVALTRDGLYIGKGRLPLTASGEEGAVPFGALETVKIAYRVVEQKSEDSFAAAEETERRRYVFSAENLSEKARQVVLYDSVPVSNSDQVEVKLVGDAPTDEDVDDVTGRVTWTLDIAPGAKEEVEFGYDVNYPIGRDLMLR